LPELDDAEAVFLLPEEALAVEEHMLQVTIAMSGNGPGGN
jgi:hypothetical protein